MSTVQDLLDASTAAEVSCVVVEQLQVVVAGLAREIANRAVVGMLPTEEEAVEYAGRVVDLERAGSERDVAFREWFALMPKPLLAAAMSRR